MRMLTFLFNPVVNDVGYLESLYLPFEYVLCLLLAGSTGLRDGRARKWASPGPKFNYAPHSPKKKPIW